ncbi:MAG: hypothetical protein G8D27_00290 [Buchnera aphidicola (Periphyllus aceris)]|nr:hypothetical protein [Buchnera aphidicola (Periphyllus aceris)]
MNMYDFFIIFIIFFSSLIGLIRGFIKETISFLVFCIGFFIFYIFYFYIIDGFSFFSDIFLELFLFIMFFGFLILSLEYFLSLFYKDFIKLIGVYYFNNLILGFLFGLFRGFLLIYIFLYIITDIVHLNIFFYLRGSILIPLSIKFVYFFKNIL